MDTVPSLINSKQDQHMRLLYRVGQECVGVQDRETLIGRISHLIGEYMETLRVGIALRDGANLTFIATPLGCIEEFNAVLPNTLPLAETSLCSWVIQHGASALITDVNDPRYRPVKAFHDTVAELAVPIPGQREPVQGVIDIQTANPRHRLAEDQPVIELIAQQLGLTLDNLAWQIATQRRARYNALTETLREHTNLYADGDDLFAFIVSTLTTTLLLRAAAIYGIEHDQLVLRASSHPEGSRHQPPRQRPLPPHIWAYATGQRPELPAEPTPDGTGTIIDVGLVSGNALLGAIQLVTLTPLERSEHDLLVEFGASLGQIIERNRLFRSMYAATKRTSLFARIISLIRQSLHVRELVGDVMATLGQALDADYATVALLEDGEELQLHGSYRTLSAPDHQTAAEALLRSELALAIRERRQLTDPELDSATFGPGAWSGLQSLNIRALVWVPLQVNGQWLGVVCMYKLHDRPAWTSDDLRLLTDVADQLALAFRQMYLYESERQRRRELEALQEIIHAISGELSLVALCQNVVQKVTEVFNIAAAAVLMWNSAQDRMEVIASLGFSPRYLPHLAMSQARVQQWIARVAPPPPLYIPDVRHDPLVNGNAAHLEGLSSLYAQPLMVDGAFGGWLQMYSRGTVRSWSNDEGNLIESIAQQIAQAIHTARRYEKEHLLRTDAEQSYHHLRAVLEELDATRERLIQSEKLRALGELASGVAHDFNNLLASILGNAQLLLMDADSDRQETLHMIERAAKDGAVTVRRIQEYARSAETVYDDVVNLRDVVNVGLEFTRPSWRDGAQQRGVPLSIITNLTPVHVIGSAAELREVFVNLLVNAVDALPQGGTITIATGIQQDLAFFSVADDGKGIPAENRTRIFDPFFTTKPIGQGTGMGLAVALSIIQRHRGTLSVEDVHPHGTRFVIQLPRHQSVGVEQRAVAVTPKTEAQRILVVDDETAVRQVVGRVLTHDNHVVVMAASGEEALQLLAKQPYDIIISDLGMPGMNGWELLGYARQHYPTIATVLMTGWGYESDTDQAQARGADIVLTKPFEVQVLRKAIADLVGSHTVN